MTDWRTLPVKLECSLPGEICREGMWTSWSASSQQHTPFFSSEASASYRGHGHICLSARPEESSIHCKHTSSNNHFVLTRDVYVSVHYILLMFINRVADVFGQRSLCSSGTNRLVVPPFRLSTVGSRAFPVVAAKIWNALPDSLVSITPLQSFQCHLETFLFHRSFS